MSLVNDFNLIRSNAHLYNTGIEGLEVRIMVDAMVNFAYFLMKFSIRVLNTSVNIALRKFLITQEVEELINDVERADDVKNYLELSKLSEDFLIGKSVLLTIILTNKDHLNVSPYKPFLPSSKTSALNNTNSIKLQKISKNLHTPQQKTNETDYFAYEEGEDDYVDDVYNEPVKKKPKIENKSKVVQNQFAAGKIKGKAKKSLPGSIAAANAPLVPLQEESIHTYKMDPEKVEAWMVEADNVMKTILKHPHIDPTKSTIIADFVNPIDPSNPLMAEYLSIIEKPMDLTTLRYNLDSGLLNGGSEEFYELLLLIFENTTKFYSHQAEKVPSVYSQQLAKRCKALVRYKVLSISYYFFYYCHSKTNKGELCEVALSRDFSYNGRYRTFQYKQIEIFNNIETRRSKKRTRGYYGPSYYHVDA